MKGIKKKIAALRHQIGAISKNAENPFFHSRDWAWIEDYEGRYAVSGRGDVLSFYKNGKHKILKHNVTRDGYHLVRLYKDSKQNDCVVSRLVAKSFVKNPNNKPEVNHKDGDKSNNIAENLEWVSRSENVQHAFDSGLIGGRKGESNNFCKLTKRQVLDIRNAYKLGCFSQTEIAKAYEMTPQGIHNIVHKITWSHI